MFEGLIASILNRFFSGYIDEIDYKNLQIGLISGTVELNNLALNAEALYQFNVPIEICGGSIGKLKVKVPWTSIYNKPVVVNIEDVLVLVRPMTASQLQDPARVEKIVRAAKRKQIQQLSKGISMGPVEKSDNFFGVLFDTVINNIQINVKNIHVRYEDCISMPKASFCAGVVLKDVTASSTDELGNLTKLDADAKFVYKSAAISGLTMYYNTFTSSTNPSIISANGVPEESQILMALKSSIDKLSLNEIPFVTMLKSPIEVSAKVRLNRFKDEESLKKPHITCNAHAAAIDFVINQNQALYTMNAIKNFVTLSKNRSYVQYRPTSKLSENAKAWWQYAYTSVVEARIRCFSWQRIKIYRDQYREYKQLYIETLTSTDVSIRSKNRGKMEMIEYDLNIATIVIARQQAKIEHKRELEKAGQEADQTSISPVDKLYELTAEERDQLYDMLGISSSADGSGDKFQAGGGSSFIQIKINMDKIGVTLVETNKNILQCYVSDIALKGSVEPSDFSFSVQMLTRTLEVNGFLNDDQQLPIVKSSVDLSKDSQFFVISVSRLPSNVDNIEFSVECKIMPLEIVYEYPVLSRVITAFLTAANVRMLFDAAQQNLAWLGNYSTAGLMFAIESHKRFKVSALIYSPILVIPEKGSRGGSEIVIYLGTVQVDSDLSKHVAIDKTNINTIAINMYDKMMYSITQTQVVIAEKETNWIDYFMNTKEDEEEFVDYVVPNTHGDREFAAKDYPPHRNLIVPINLSGQILLSIEPKFKKLPQFVFESTLDKLKIAISDHDILVLYKFVTSLPLPAAIKLDDEKFLTDSFYDPSVNKLINVLEPSKEVSSTLTSTDKEQLLESEDENLVCEADVWKTAFDYLDSPGRPLSANFTKFLFRFNLNEMAIMLKTQFRHGQQLSITADIKDDEQFLLFSLNNLKCDLAVTKLGVAGQFAINQICLADDRSGCKEQHRNILINEETDQLVVVQVRYIRPTCSYFTTIFNSISVLATLDISTIYFLFRQEVLLSIVTFGISIVHRIGDDVAQVPNEEVASDTQSLSKNLTEKVSTNIASLPVMQFHLTMNTVNWQLIASDNRVLADIEIKGLSVTVGVDSTHQLYLEACLNDVDICRSQAEDYYVDVVNLLDDNVFNAKLQYLNGRSTIDLQVGRLRVIFVSQFYFDLFDFASSLLEVDTATTKSMFNQARSTMYKQLGDATEVIRTGGQPDIVINANISAPTVLIPRNYISRHCLLLQMGDMIISSGEEITEVDTFNIAAYSTIQLMLKSVQASRVYMKTTDEIEIRELIIHPVTLTFDLLILMRSKCTPFDGNFTFLKITSIIDLIKAELSLASTQLFFAILDDNILNFASTSTLAKSSIADESNSPDYEKSIFSSEFVPSSKSALATNIAADQSPSIEAAADIVLRGVDVTIVEPRALNTDVDAVPIVANSSSSPTSQPVASLRIRISKIKFKSNKDGTLDASIKIGPLFVDDIRPKSKLAVRSVICPEKSEEHQNVQSDVNVFVADVRFTSEKDVLIDFNLGRFSVNLCLPFLIYLYTFIMDAVFYLSAGTVFDMRVEGGSVMRIVDLSETKMKFVEFAEDTEIKEIEIERPSQKSRLRAIRLKGDVLLSHVALYAEPEKQNSQILLLSATAGVKLTQWVRDEILEVALQMQNLSVVLQRAIKPALQVLKPCTGKLSMRQTRESMGDIIVNCEFSSIFTNLTPAIYAVIIGVIGSLSEPGVTSKDSRSVSIIEDGDQLLEIRQLDRDKYKKLKNTASSGDSSQCYDMVTIVIGVKNILENAMAARKRKPLERLNIRVENVFVVYSEEIYSELIPLMVSMISVDGCLSDWTTVMRVDVNLEVECSYYNETLNVWEPLLDPLMIHENAYRPWRCRFAYVGLPALPLESTFEHVEGALTRAFSTLPQKSISSTRKHDEFVESANRLIVQSGFKTGVNTKPEIATCLYLQSLYPLTVNMSPASMRLLLRLSLVIVATPNDNAQFEGESKIRSFLEIINKTGVSVNVVLSHLVNINESDLQGCTVSYSIKEDSSKDRKSISSQDSIMSNLRERGRAGSLRSALISPLFALNPLLSPEKVGRKFNQIDEQVEKYRFKLQFHNLSTIKGLSFKKHGSSIRSLYKLDTSNKYHIVVEVKNQFSFQSISILSPTEICNNTDVALTLYCERNEDMPNIFDWPYEPSQFPDIYILRILQPQEYYNIPLPIVYHCCVLASPDDPRYAPVKIYDPVYAVEDSQKKNLKSPHKEAHQFAIKDLGRTIPGINRSPNVDDSSTSLKNIYISKFLAARPSVVRDDKKSIGLGSDSTSRAEQSYDFHFRVTTDKADSSNRNPLKNIFQMERSDQPSPKRDRLVSLTSSEMAPEVSLIRLIVISPVLYIENCMPFAVSLDDDVLDIGHTISWHGPQHITSITSKFRFHDVEYEGTINEADLFLNRAFSVIKFTARESPSGPIRRTEQSEDNFINVNLWSKLLNRAKSNLEQSQEKLVMFIPMWFYNFTGLNLQVKCDNSRQVCELANHSDIQLLPIPFAQNRQNMKIRIKLNGTWSDKASLDGIGVTSTLISKVDKRIYQFFLTIRVSNNGLTRMVYVTSQYTIINNSEVALEFRQTEQSVPVSVEPGACMPFWPALPQVKTRAGTPSETLILFVRLQNLGSPWVAFSVTDGSQFALSIGQNLTISISGLPTVTISVNPYSTGDSPVRLKNLCDDIKIGFHQEFSSKEVILRAYESTAYAWTDPTLPLRLFWHILSPISYGNAEFEVLYNMDGHGVIDIDTADGKCVHIYWFSYYENLQRSFLITDDAQLFCSIVVPDLCSMEVFVNLSELRMSLLTNNYEFALFTCKGSISNWELQNTDVVPELKKITTTQAGRWLDYSFNHNALISPIVNRKPYSIDYTKMEMDAPEKGKLDKTFQPAIKLFYRQSRVYMSAFARVNSVKIYNQLSDALFPVVFCPMKHTLSSEPLVNCDVTLLTRGNVYIIRSGHLAVREFSLNIDTGFMGSLYGWYTSWMMHEQSIFISARTSKTAEPKNVDSFDTIVTAPSGALFGVNDELRELLLKDIATNHIDVLRTTFSKSKTDSYLFVFDYFEISQISLELSFSMNASSPDPANEERMVEELLGAVGHALAFTIGKAVSSFNNVPFRFKGMTVNHSIHNTSSLIRLLQTFYIIEAAKQAYVLVLGLNVLGNPYGLLKQFSDVIGKGLYDPVVNSIKDPSTARENISKSLDEISIGMSKTASTAANSVSQICDHLGRLLATASLDKHNRETRNRRINEANQGDMQNALKYAGRNVVGGWIKGARDLLIEPYEAASTQGRSNLGYGLVRGVVGAATKPAGGLFDGATIFFRALGRIIDTDDEPRTNRLPRMINPELGLQPYTKYGSSGMNILKSIQAENELATGEFYWAHVMLNKKMCVLVTNRQIYVLRKSSHAILTRWKLKDQPLDITALSSCHCSGKKIVFTRKTTRLLSSGVNVIDGFEFESDCAWLASKINGAIILEGNQNDEEDDIGGLPSRRSIAIVDL